VIPKEEPKGPKKGAEFPIPKELLKPQEEKKEEKKMEEEKIPIIEKKVNDHDKEIEDLKAQIAKMKIDIAECLRWYIIPILAILFGLVGAAYLAQGIVFKEVTQVAYGIGLIGGSIIAYLLYRHYLSKDNQNQQS